MLARNYSKQTKQNAKFNLKSIDLIFVQRNRKKRNFWNFNKMKNPHKTNIDINEEKIGCMSKRQNEIYRKEI